LGVPAGDPVRRVSRRARLPRRVSRRARRAPGGPDGMFGRPKLEDPETRSAGLGM